MELKSIKQANKILQKIESLTSEIIQIDKFANELLQGSKDFKINLSFNSTIEKRKKKLKLDEDGSIMNNHSADADRYSIRFFYDFSKYAGVKTENKSETSLSMDVTEKILLQSVGLLIQNKTDEREKEIAKLQRLGFTI